MELKHQESFVVICLLNIYTQLFKVFFPIFSV